MRLEGFAPAKVNLTLHVGPPRSDGRHPLDSLVAFASVGDHLTVERAAPGVVDLQIAGRFGAPLLDEPDNLVLAAARLLQTRCGSPGPGAVLRLQKELPLASGIGGGSADAAAALRLLNRLWGTVVPNADLAAFAAPLGGDAPACVLSRPLMMRGDGIEITPIAMPELDAVLVNCGAQAPTKAVYAMFDQLGLGETLTPSPCGPWRDRSHLLDDLAIARNDLETAAMLIAPGIADTLSFLNALPEVILARLSGSGATCFAIVDDPEIALAIEDLIQDEQPSWWARAVRLGAVDVDPTPL